LPFCHVNLKAKKPTPFDDPSSFKGLGDHLKKRRFDLGINQVDLAKLLRVTETTIVHWEKHQTAIGYQYLPRIIDFLGYLPFTDTFEKTIGERIVLLRHIRGLTQEELAPELNASPSKMHRWETGVSYPPKHIVEAVDSLLHDATHSLVIGFNEE
jgi:DNA-binding XRE family transcriptional regulator